MVGFDDLYRQGDAVTWQAGKQDVVLQVAQLLMGVGDSSRILDFGCGTGWTARILATGQSRYLGIDPSAEGIAVAEREHAGESRIRFHRLTIDETLSEALHGARFTHVFALDALYFVPDLESTLRALHDVLEEDGLLTTVSHIYRESRVAARLVDSITQDYSYPHFLSGVQWRTLLDRNGWSDIRRYRFHDRHPFDPAAFLGYPQDAIAQARELYEHEGALVITARK